VDPFAVEAMKAHYEANVVPKVKMLRPKMSEMPMVRTRRIGPPRG